MKPIILVLLVAASAYAAPSVNIQAVNYNDVVRPYDSGVGVNSGLIKNVLDLIDNGDLNVYTVTLRPAIEELADRRDSQSQALAVSQTMAVVLALGSGIPGDSCAAASAISNLVNGGNGAGFGATLASAVDILVALATNPNSLKNVSGPRGNCQGQGRSYNNEAAWNIIFDSVPASAGLVNEEYCACKRLYNSLSLVSNNVAAAVTAASAPGVIQIVARNINVFSNLLRSAASGGNVYAFAGQARSALLRG